MKIIKFSNRTVDYINIEFKTKDKLNLFIEKFNKRTKKNIELFTKHKDFDKKKLEENNLFFSSIIIKKQKYIELEEKILDFKQKINDLNIKIIERVKFETSKTKKCKKCNSIINKEFINDINCLICNENLLYTESDLKRFNNYNEKLKKTIEIKEEYSNKLFNEFEENNEFEYTLEIYNLDLYYSFVILDIVDILKKEEEEN